MTAFEWDENKRHKNIESKNLDSVDAVIVFDGRVVITAPSRYPFEDRFVSTAILDDGKFYTVVWTWRGGARRIISFRRARDGEERAYRQIFR
ncbi:BrnT family toxin [Methylocapsa sp. S129]|uniref:BrnT family toxin n=1 Tax=Methylocapsa sp. S129 TaxID=1641869 RepID=UPI00131BDFC0|nr:BrnT family toxin [Methylocapsa sp. S129]